MGKHILLTLIGAVIGALAAALVWWSLLALFALLAGPASSVRPALAAVAVGVVPALGLIHGAIIGAARGRLSGGVLLEMAAAPFAWVMTAGEGMVGGVVMLLSLLPGACLGSMAGLWLAGVPAGSVRWPDEAAVGAIVGVALSLMALNLYVQWPTLGPGGQSSPPAEKPGASGELHN